MITNIILILVDENNDSVLIKNVQFLSFDRFKYSKYSQNRSILIACFNTFIAKNLRNSIDAICSSDIKDNVHELCYNITVIPRIIELIQLFKKYLKTIDTFTFDNIKFEEENKNDLIYFSLNFYNVFIETLRLIDEVIESGVYFEKVKKVAIKSVIHGRNIPFLDVVKFPWVYNDNSNVIIDYSKIVEWKSIGVFPVERRLVELKYFL